MDQRFAFVLLLDMVEKLLVAQLQRRVEWWFVRQLLQGRVVKRFVSQLQGRGVKWFAYQLQGRVEEWFALSQLWGNAQQPFAHFFF